jgi:hypothetical protein
MKFFATGILVLLIALLLSAGCTQSAPSPQQTMVPTTAPPAITPAVIVPTSVPQVTVTVIHYIVPTKLWKDSDLHISFAAPQDLNVITRQQSLPDGSQGLIFKTEVVPNDVFTITTFPISLSDDQAYRDTFRTWDPAPVETTVVMKGITYDRFESTKDGKTHVGYVARKSSANDLGFSSVLVFTADNSLPYQKEDYENIVASFTYFTTKLSSIMSGQEIPRVR